MEYGMTLRTAAPFAETVARVREALKEQGFGVLTEIDVRATMRDKLGEDMEHYTRLAKMETEAEAAGNRAAQGDV